MPNSLPSLSWSSDDTLWGRWQRHADASPDREAIGFVRAGEPTERWTWVALIEQAARYASWLKTAGVQAGDTCAIISRHHPQFYPLYLGLSCLGAIPTVLAYPNARLHPEKFRTGLLGMARHSGLDWILAEREIETILTDLTATPEAKMKGLLFPYEAVLTSEQPLPRGQTVSSSSPALLQHSSGTTGLQKAVVLSHRAVLEHVARYGRAIALNDQDRVVSWLPLYHDMGLIAAFHLPLATGIPTIHLDPFEWVMAPILLIEALAQERGTLSWLPNFAYSLMGTRVHEDDLLGLSLETVRMLINCSEPIRHESHSALLQRLRGTGLRPSSLAASYAMAEATFAVTQTPAGRSATTRVVSREELRLGRAEAPHPGQAERACVSSGAPIDGCELKSVDPAGREVDDYCVGEVWVRSASLFDGYRNRPDLTDAALSDGWYRTGDLGFRAAGEWYIVGRQKDLIIVAGKNLYPEDIEDSVSSVAGVTPGRVVAFGRDDATTGTEMVCVVVETELDETLHGALRTRILDAVRGIDVTLGQVFIVAPRWLIKSSSGKVSRAANRDRALSELSPEDDS